MIDHQAKSMETKEGLAMGTLYIGVHKVYKLDMLLNGGISKC
jgi:hypothetical protein